MERVGLWVGAWYRDQIRIRQDARKEQVRMTKKRNKKMLENPWAYVKKKHRLNARQIAMAKELGIRPKTFGSMGAGVIQA